MATQYDDFVNEAAQMFSLRPGLLFSMMKQESGFNPNARSPVGAMGLMQLMPGTAKEVGVVNPYDPKESVMGGAKYLRKMLDMFGGDERLAVMAYNAGPGNVKKYKGNVPFKETQNYVSKVLGSVPLFEGARRQSPQTASALPEPEQDLSFKEQFLNNPFFKLVEGLFPSIAGGRKNV